MRIGRYFKCAAWSICFAALLLPNLADAETSLWKISKAQHHVLLGGTMHLLSPSDYPLPDEFEQAFRESAVLVLETDLAALSRPETKEIIRKRLIFDGDASLKDVLTPSTYKALLRFCRSRGLSIGMINTMKPALVVLTLTMNEMSRLEQNGAGVEQHFLNRSQAAGKRVEGLESAETQIDALASMDKSGEDKLVVSALEDLSKTPAYLDDLKKAWRFGRLAELEKMRAEHLEKDFPEFNRRLLSDRNDAWLPKIEAILASPGTEFILVGALHLAGTDGLLAKLKARGYEVEYY